MPDLKIRPAVLADCAVINEIYNHYVEHSTCTYQTEVETMQGRQTWFADHGPQHPIIVAELDGLVVGWGALSRFHPRSAYAATVENAVYLHHRFLGREIGRALMEDLIQRATALGHHTIVALISAEQAASISLHQKLGFSRAGVIREAGYKFQTWLDVVYMQKML